MAMRIHLEPDRGKRRALSVTNRIRHGLGHSRAQSSLLLSLDKFRDIIFAFERNVKLELEMTAGNVSGYHDHHVRPFVLKLLSHRWSW